MLNMLKIFQHWCYPCINHLASYFLWFGTSRQTMGGRNEKEHLQNVTTYSSKTDAYISLVSGREMYHSFFF
jgi:hypothetical protein